MNSLRVLLGVVSLFLMGSSVSFAAFENDEVEAKAEQAEGEADDAHALRMRSEGPDSLDHLPILVPGGAFEIPVSRLSFVSQVGEMLSKASEVFSSVSERFSFWCAQGAVTDSEDEVITKVSINDLPPEMIDLIAQFLGVRDLRNLALATRYLSEASQDQRRLALQEEIQRIEGLAHSEDSNKCRQAVKAIESLFPLVGQDDRSEFIVLLLSLAKDEDYEVRSSAVKALGRVLASGQALESERVPLLETFLSLAKDEDEEFEVRSSAAKALGSVLASGQVLESERVPLLDALLSLAQDKDSMVRGAAAKALGSILASGQGSEKERALLLETFISLAQDENDGVLFSTARALGNVLTSEQVLEGERSLLLEALLSLVKDEESEVRSSAAKALESLQV